MEGGDHVRMQGRALHEENARLRSRNRVLSVFTTILLMCVCFSMCALLWMQAELQLLGRNVERLKASNCSVAAGNSSNGTVEEAEEDVAAVFFGFLFAAMDSRNDTLLGTSMARLMMNESGGDSMAAALMTKEEWGDIETGIRMFFAGAWRAHYHLFLLEPREISNEPLWVLGWFVLPHLLLANVLFGRSFCALFPVAWALSIVVARVLAHVLRKESRLHKMVSMVLDHIANPRRWIKGFLFRVLVVSVLVCEGYISSVVITSFDGQRLLSLRSLVVLGFCVISLVWSWRAAAALIWTLSVAVVLEFLPFRDEIIFLGPCAWTVGRMILVSEYLHILLFRNVFDLLHHSGGRGGNNH